MHDPWHVDETAFPRQAPPAEQLRFLLNYAVLAPSGHNTQPWLFQVREDQARVYADRTRALPVVDPHDRELVISCGAALYNLRVAIRRFGYAAPVELLPDPAEPDLLAVARLGAPRPPTPDDERRFAAIPLRRTNRRPFEARPLPAELIARLSAAAGEESAWLAVVEDEGRRNAIAELISEGDRIQGADPSFRRELAAWIHPNRTRCRDGMPGFAHGFGDLMSRLGPFVIRTFDWGNGQAAKDRQLALGSPVLAVIGTAADDPRSWLQAGQALSSVLLLARADGVFASYLNQPTEIPDLRRRLAARLERGDYPQLVLRFGYGEPVRPTPRRLLTDVLLEPAP